MASDPAPDHMRLTFADRRSERECRTAIRGEAKLVDATMAGERIDERLTRNTRRRLAQSGDQLRDRDREPRALLRRQPAVLALEQREAIECRHRLPVVELGEELLERVGHVAEAVRLLIREFLIDAGGSHPHAVVSARAGKTAIGVMVSPLGVGWEVGRLAGDCRPRRPGR